MIIKSRPGSSDSVDNSLFVPRQTSFHVPEGIYTATILGIRKLHNTANANLLRILFKIELPGVPVDHLAKLDLKADLSETSDLWQVVCKLAGRKALQNASERQFDLDSLVGLPVDLEIAHVLDRAADYEFPLVVVLRVESAGTLVREETDVIRPSGQVNAQQLV